MPVIRLFIVVMVFIYLCFQSMIDAKTGYVYRIPNIAMFDISVALWLYAFFVAIIKDQIIYIYGIQALLFILVLYLTTIELPFFGKIMQPADAKAFSVIYFSSVFIMGFDIAPFILLVTMLAGHTVFILWHKLIKSHYKGVTVKERKPYFPFITIGYSISMIMVCMVLGHAFRLYW